jgi:hypothetical protein
MEVSSMKSFLSFAVALIAIGAASAGDCAGGASVLRVRSAGVCQQAQAYEYETANVATVQTVVVPTVVSQVAVQRVVQVQAVQHVQQVQVVQQVQHVQQVRNVRARANGNVGRTFQIGLFNSNSNGGAAAQLGLINRN